MSQPLDAAAVRRWCRIALDSLGEARESIDAINVYPVADQDTGTNLYLTVESAAQAVEAAGTAGPSLAQSMRTMAHGALIGARGNSGTILAQLLRGVAEVLQTEGEPAGPQTLYRALRRASDSAYQAVARPVEGTMLTVAVAAAEAAGQAAGQAADVADVARAACAGARQALAATPARLAVLDKAGVIDAGGLGLLTVLEALDAALSGRAPERARHHGLARPAPAHPCPVTSEGPGFEVLYLLEAADDAVAALRGQLLALGESLVLVGGDGLWNIHVHTDHPGPAVEAGIEAGRPHRIRITHLGSAVTKPERAARAVLSVQPGDGLAALCEEAGATALTVRTGEPPGSGELAAAIQRTHAQEVVLLPNDDALWHAAAAAAEHARQAGVRVSVIPTRSPVQGIAALAVHAAERRFDEDVVTMTSAAGATRFGEVTVAERRSWTSAGICQAGDVLGLVDGDVVVIGAVVQAVAAEVLRRMLSAGGELVTLVIGAGAPPDLAASLTEVVRHGHLGVDTLVCDGRQGAPLLIGVE